MMLDILVVCLVISQANAEGPAAAATVLPSSPGAPLPGVPSPGAPSSSSPCCDHITDHVACANACRQVTSEEESGARIPEVSAMVENCPETMVNLWECINSTFEAAVSGGGGGTTWWGLPCCQYSLSTQCYNTCRRAKSVNELNKSCPSSDATFYRCIDRQKAGHQCCHRAAGSDPSSQCRAVCRAIFLQDADPTPSQSSAVHQFCPDQVLSCIGRKGIPLHTQRQPEPEALACCGEAPSAACGAACRRALTAAGAALTDDDRVELMLPACGGVVSPHIRMWQCFLTHADNNNRNRRRHQLYTVADGAKLLCCQKARSAKCTDLCTKTHGQDWNRNYLTFNGQCGSNPLEADMNKCLHEVEETCTMGCSGLSYCTNFNHRPTELFRSCNKMADDGARREVALWVTNGRISLPAFEGYSIPIKDVRRCRPETWKTIACALQIKPCHLQGMRICKADCMSVLLDCIDTEGLEGASVMATADNVCNVLAPPADDQPCLSLSKYINESPHRATAHQVTNPCQSKPCDEKEVCVVNRRKCRHPDSPHCQPYTCLPACPVGDASLFHVPHGALVRLPIAGDGALHCHRVCRCGRHHSLTGCVEADCTDHKQCFASSGGIYAHGTRFSKGCNECLCHSGEIVCTQRKCLSADPSAPERARFTGLPCNCDRDYAPVCAHSGRTFPNACVAKCLGVRERHLEAGPCSSQAPCGGEDSAAAAERSSRRRLPPRCPGDGQVCVPRPRVCLSHTEPCPQYECVAMGSGCDHHHHDPVCDSQQDEFGNVCLMMSRGRSLQHRGHCLQHCSPTGSVCGLDGETYSSECAAWAGGVPADYHGACRAVPHPGAQPPCPGVPCAPAPAACRPITPPGACCPLCAGEIRVLYSEAVAARVSMATGPVSVGNVTEALSRHLAVAECGVTAYLAPADGTLVILVVPLVPSPTTLQVAACMAEADKLERLLSSATPTLTAYAAVAPLLAVVGGQRAAPVHAGGSGSAAAARGAAATVHVSHGTLLFLSAALVTMFGAGRPQVLT